MILPGADAMMSILPKYAHPSATQNRVAMRMAIARPIGDAGVSTISSAAGRNASSSFLRRSLGRNGTTTFLANFMDSTLQAIDRGVAPAGLDQFIVTAVLDQPAAFDGHDAVGRPYGRQAMRDDKDRAPLGDPLHVLLDHALTLVVEGARCLVEDQDAGIGDERARDGDALTLPA